MVGSARRSPLRNRLPLGPGPRRTRKCCVPHWYVEGSNIYRDHTADMARYAVVIAVPIGWNRAFPRGARDFGKGSVHAFPLISLTLGAEFAVTTGMGFCVEFLCTRGPFPASRS